MYIVTNISEFTYRTCEMPYNNNKLVPKTASRILLLLLPVCRTSRRQTRVRYMPIRHFVVFQTRLRLLLYHQLDIVLRYKLLLSQRGFNEATFAIKPIFFSDVRASPPFTKPLEHHRLFNFYIGANRRAPIVFWCSSHRNTLETGQFFPRHVFI